MRRLSGLATDTGRAVLLLAFVLMMVKAFVY